jgi:hypothetical protein
MITVEVKGVETEASISAPSNIYLIDRTGATSNTEIEFKGTSIFLLLGENHI